MNETTRSPATARRANVITTLGRPILVITGPSMEGGATYGCIEYEGEPHAAWVAFRYLHILAVDWVAHGVSPAPGWTYAGFPMRGCAGVLPERMRVERRMVVVVEHSHE